MNSQGSLFERNSLQSFPIKEAGLKKDPTVRVISYKKAVG
jgi:hypothetical protein